MPRTIEFELEPAMRSRTVFVSSAGPTVRLRPPDDSPGFIMAGVTLRPILDDGEPGPAADMVLAFQVDMAAGLIASLMHDAQRHGLSAELSAELAAAVDAAGSAIIHDTEVEA